MRIPAVSMNVKTSDEEATGLLLSLLTALMKANKTNNVSSVSHFFRERLGRKQDRATLNVMLNALSQRLATQSKIATRRGTPILDSAGSGSQEATEIGALVEKIESLSSTYVDVGRYKKTLDNIQNILNDHNKRLEALEALSKDR
jgi:hypothetical protein